jgi:hypothetical protein
MKRLFYSLVVLAVISIFTSCTPKPEELILGTWNLTDVQIKNMDEYAQSMIDMQMPFVEMQVTQINDQITAINEELKTLKDKKVIETKNAELQTLQAQMDEANKQKEELTIEKVKEDFTKNFDEMKKEFKMIFNEDKTYENVLEGAKGTWTISEDGKTLTTKDENGKEDAIVIDEIAKEKMVLSISNVQGEMTIEMSMTFGKGETAIVEEVKEEVKK